MYWNAAALNTPFGLDLAFIVRGATVSFVNMLIYSDAARSGFVNSVAQSSGVGWTMLIHEIQSVIWGKSKSCSFNATDHGSVTVS